MEIVRRRANGSRPAWAAAAVAAAVAAGFLAASCSTSPAGTAPAASAPADRSGSASQPGGVISLTAITTLKSLFNRADGRTRLLLILSPT